jgi:hypothetical protein
MLRTIVASRKPSNSASANDYLEKIFQLPYWVRPMTETSSSAFLEDRLSQLQPLALPPAMKSDERTIGEAHPEVQPPPVFASLIPRPENPPTIEQLPGLEEVPTNLSTEALAQTPAPDSSSTAESDSAPVNSATLAKQLALSKEEQSLMKKLAWCAGASPRRLLRFLNVYQVIKASLPNADAEALAEGSYASLMSQVAIVTGAPDLLPIWLQLLATLEPASNVVALRESLDFAAPKLDPEQITRLRLSLDLLAAHQPETTVKELATWANVARRFSFTG